MRKAKGFEIEYCNSIWEATQTLLIYILLMEVHFFNQSNWNPQCIYNELLEQYLQYVTLRYNNGGLKVGAAFDGYDDMHLTKSVKNYRPGEVVVVAPDTKIANLQMKVLEKKKRNLRTMA